MIVLTVIDSQGIAEEGRMPVLSSSPRPSLDCGKSQDHMANNHICILSIMCCRSEAIDGR